MTTKTIKRNWLKKQAEKIAKAGAWLDEIDSTADNKRSRRAWIYRFKSTNWQSRITTEYAKEYAALTGIHVYTAQRHLEAALNKEANE